MRAHNLLEALDREPTLLNLRASKMVKDAQKFAFNPGDISDEIATGANDFARDLMAHGIFPLPYDVTLFEFGPMGLVAGESADCFTWCLVWKEVKDDRSVKLYMMAFVKYGSMNILPVPVVAEVEVNKPNQDGWWGHYNLIYADQTSMDAYERARTLARTNIGDLRSRIEFEVHTILTDGPRDRIQGLIDEALSGDKDAIFTTYGKALDVAFTHMLNAIGLISTRGMTVIEKREPKFMNRARRKKGKHPLYAFKTLVINPTLLRIPGAKGSGERASPRLHLRRGHVRTMKDGRKIMVQPTLVGNKSKGAVMKDYVVDVSRGMPIKKSDS